MARFCWWHSHTTASDGRQSPGEILETAQQNQIRHVALTDHDTLDGYLQAKPVPGVTLWPGMEMQVYDLGFYGHLTVLFPPSAIADFLPIVERRRRKERVDIQELAHLPCVVLSGCAGSILYRYSNQYDDSRRWWMMVEVIERWKNLFPDRLFIEIQPSFGWPHATLDISCAFHLPLIVTLDAHSTIDLPYLSEEDTRDLHKAVAWQHAITRTALVVSRLKSLEARTIGPLDYSHGQVR